MSPLILILERHQIVVEGPGSTKNSKTYEDRVEPIFFTQLTKTKKGKIISRQTLQRAYLNSIDMQYIA